MAVNNNSFYKYEEHNAQVGYRGAWLVKPKNASKYSLLVATETIPSVFGTQDSFEFDLLNSSVKGKVAGKSSLDDKEVEVLHTRDNVYRLRKLENQVLDFLCIDSNFVGYKYSGTLSYRPNDAQNDIWRGTVTITPMSASKEPIADCRDLVEETLCYAYAIPNTVAVNDEIDASVVQSDAVVTYSFVKIASDWQETAETTALTATGNKIKVNTGAKGLYGITVSATGYASWTTTIYVE